jgi:hypothetical protein
MGKLLLKNARFSYVNVWEPKAINGGDDAKYSVSILIPKSDTAQIEAIKKDIEEAKVEGKAKWGGKIPPKLKTPLRDGDEERPDDPIYVGHYFINANSKDQPGILDRRKIRITTQSEFYSGCYGNVSVNFYAYDAAGNRGIACGLNNLQKVRDGECLGGKTRAEDDFDSYEDDENDLLG